MGKKRSAPESQADAVKRQKKEAEVEGKKQENQSSNGLV